AAPAPASPTPREAAAPAPKKATTAATAAESGAAATTAATEATTTTVTSVPGPPGDAPVMGEDGHALGRSPASGGGGDPSWPPWVAGGLLAAAAGATLRFGVKLDRPV